MDLAKPVIRHYFFVFLLKKSCKRGKSMGDCGIVGVFSTKHQNVYGKLVHSLHVLQHRGEDACGILICNNGNFRLERRIGLVSTNFGFSEDCIIRGDRGIGHTRYPTSNLTNESSTDDIQPIEISYPWITFYIAHNGTITSFCGVPLSQTESTKRHASTETANFECSEDQEINMDVANHLLQTVKSEMIGGTDTETVGRILAHVARGILAQNEMPTSQAIEKALMKVAPRLTGSYAFLIVADDSVMGVRDPYGIRPLCLFELPDGYVMASESCVLNELRKLFYSDLKLPRKDVEPGTAVIISDEGVRAVRFANLKQTAYCIFEDAYFSRPDSNVRGQILSSFRQRCGERLGKRLKMELTLQEAEDSIIIPVPDGGIPFGVGLARSTGIPLMSHGLIRDKYTGRTFIRGPEIQGLDRAALVMRKLSFLHDVIENKIVILADDSLVRGTTTRRVSAMAMDSGARDVIWCFNFPPIKYMCPLGIEMFKGGREQFIANKVIPAENLYELEKGIAKILGAKATYYMNLEDYLQELYLTGDQACTGCITGIYPFDELTRLYGV
jgi:amidophosphoribosyltransferase